MFDPMWFNLSAPTMKVFGQYVKLWNVFNRVAKDNQHYWGFGLLQINKRHLFYIGYNSVSILFIGKSA